MSSERNSDSYGAFCTANPVALEPAGSGKLDGLSVAVKDVMDIAGTTTGFGHPQWLATHSPASDHADVVERLLKNGATLAGRTVSDELSYSLSGENIHYGTPVNPRDPTRVAGGSSSGSVAAVASGLVDFAIGTDCAGSVRLPASYCGVLGMRPTHGGVSATGVIPFAPSFDTVGWFARDAHTLQLAGQVLLDTPKATATPTRLLVATDCFDLVDSNIRQALQQPIARVAKHFSQITYVNVSESDLEPFMECFRIIQGYEIWQSLGEWIEKNKPEFGPGINERVAAAKAFSERQVNEARDFRHIVQESLNDLVQPGDVLCLPTSPRVAPLKDTATDTMEVIYRYQAISLLSIAGLGGLPEISLPLGESNGLPLGLSLVGASGNDHDLLQLVNTILA